MAEKPGRWSTQYADRLVRTIASERGVYFGWLPSSEVRAVCKRIEILLATGPIDGGLMVWLERQRKKGTTNDD